MYSIPQFLKKAENFCEFPLFPIGTVYKLHKQDSALTFCLMKPILRTDKNDGDDVISRRGKNYVLTHYSEVA